MSISVALADLPGEIARLGAGALLITNSADGPPHVTSVLVSCEEEHLMMRVGTKTRANAAERPAVTLVWSAAVGGDYCLIVDGTAASDPAEVFVVRPTSAVLHRLATVS